MPQPGQSAQPAGSLGGQSSVPPMGNPQGQTQKEDDEDVNKLCLEVRESRLQLSSMRKPSILTDNIQRLPSNPRGPLEDEVEKKFHKGPVVHSCSCCH
jgi:hypothetical protein